MLQETEKREITGGGGKTGKSSWRRLLCAFNASVEDVTSGRKLNTPKINNLL